MTYSTPAAQKRGEARLSGRTPRTSFVPPYQSTVTPVATPPRPRKSRLSEIHYATSDSVPTSPSISAPPPFDWDAARGNRPAPYGGLTAKPASSRGVESTPKSSTSTPRKRVFRKKTVLERFVLSLKLL
ncbi:hypothetical protein DL93DRAFT_2223056 [Clavulina sp. PMI_390]|nr:hypothetical protein DL93DRAFT_2223056 [Clavulina sp. PMI_390]